MNRAVMNVGYNMDLNNAIVEYRAKLEALLAEAEAQKMLADPVGYRAKLEAEVRAKVLLESKVTRKHTGINWKRVVHSVLSEFPNGLYSSDRIIGRVQARRNDDGTPFYPLAVREGISGRAANTLSLLKKDGYANNIGRGAWQYVKDLPRDDQETGEA